MNMANVIQTIAPRRKWLRIVIITLSLLLILLAADMIWVRVWRHIPIGYNTTRLTGPLRPDGLVNYAAALDSKYGKGITPENNAVPLLIEATGSLSTDRDALFQAYRKTLFARLRIKTPVTKSGFHSYYQWVYLKLGNDLTNAQWDADITRVDPSFRLHPWTAKQYPLAARWIRSNALPLKLMREAVNRPFYYCPLVRFRYVNAANSYLENFRAIATAAAARAMFRLGHGNTAGTVSDINTDMRLATLMSQAPSLIAWLDANSVGYLALQAEAAAAGTGLLSRNQLETLLQNTLSRRAILPLTLQLNFQRFDGLAFLERASRHGIRTLITEFTPNNPNGPPKTPTLSAQLMDAVIPLNFAATMRRMNRFYDQLISALDNRPYLRRTVALNALYREVVRSASERPILRWTNPASAQLANMAGSVRGFLNNLPEGTIIRQRITVLAVDLAIYKCDHGHYPKKLSALAPKYVKTIPLDSFTGKPLKYHLLNHGQSYLLYSFGLNGVDNGGKNSGTGVGNDDIAVRGGPAVLK